MTGIMQVPAASAATGTGFTAGEQVDLTDVAPFGAKQSFATRRGILQHGR